MNKMTQEEIANAMTILNEDNLLSLGFKRIGETCNKYEGIGYQYKNFKNIILIDFMSIRKLELQFSPCCIVSRDDLVLAGIDDAYKSYKIYDTVNQYEGFKIDIHSNEELITVCEKWSNAIKNVGIKKAKCIEEYYKSL